MRSLCTLGLALVLLASAGCDWSDPGSYEAEYVVEAYLGAWEDLSVVRVSRTAPLSGSYDFSQQAVSGAHVTIERVTRDGRVVDLYTYTEHPARPGVYHSVRREVVVPRATYRLRVEIGDGAVLTSETTVPASVILDYVSADTIVFQDKEPFEAGLRPDSTQQGERVFMFIVEARDAAEDNLTPFARAIYDRGDLILEDLATSNSPLLNEAGYDVLPGGSIRVQLPWLALSFYGRNRLYVASLDKNFYDFRRTLNVQQGGSTLAPGEIPNVLDPIEGGRGVFASYARAYSDVFILPPATETNQP